MCNFENGFILCTCPPKTEKQPYLSKRKQKQLPPTPKGYRWAIMRLVRYIDEVLMEGIYELPSQELNGGLTEEWVLLNLNCENCFDAPYTPQEGDNLVLQSDEPYKYLSFMFRNGQWERGYLCGFDVVVEKVVEGKIIAQKKDNTE
jgi:hypothetical protein